MYKDSFKVVAAVPQINVADCEYNASSIINICSKLSSQDVQLVVFPELSIPGYTCGDLFRSEVLIANCDKQLARIANESRAWDMSIIVGAVIAHDEKLYNCGVVVSRGEIIAAVPKCVNDGNRNFVYGEDVDEIVTIAGKKVRMVSSQMLPIEDVYVAVIVGNDFVDASISSQTRGQVVAHLVAQEAVMGEYQRHIDNIVSRSLQWGTTYIYAGAGYGESTTDYVYDGMAVVAQNGKLCVKNERWQFVEQWVVADVGGEKPRFMPATAVQKKIDIVYQNPFVPTEDIAETYCSDAVNIQIMALMRRLEVTHCKNLVIGISGGLDSTLALLVAVKTFDRLGLGRKGILGVTMPGFGTTDRTYNNALVMMRSLGIAMREISIVGAVNQHFADIGHNALVHDVTYENSQARERTQILMDIANQVGGMVLGTGDMSELALGWATYNGDHMSMYGINAGVPKTLVKRLVKWIAATEVDEACRKALYDVIDTPISPELVPADDNGNIKQKTEDLVGPYELHDFFLYYTLKHGYAPSRIYSLAKNAFVGVYDEVTIKHWLTTFFRRFFNQQFKRSCLPDGPCVCGLSLSPRGAWQMPSDASSALWLMECEQL